MTTPQAAAACVLGDWDLVRPLGQRGIRCVLAAERDAPSQHSRHVTRSLPWPDPWIDPAAAVDVLETFARAESRPPVIFYQADGDLLLLSRYRARLARWCRFLLPPAELVEDLVDKARFQQLAGRLGLPVPRAWAFDPSTEPPPDGRQLPFPLIVKPVTRRGNWTRLVTGGKAAAVRRPDDLAQAWPKLAATGSRVIVQELVDGPETAIESYHVYADPDGQIVAEFTGKKLRTYPAAFGDSSALVLSDADDVRRVGRDVVARLGLCGVAKLDFKRDAADRLHLLEVNPRFTLWHHLAARAGLNVPALVYADLTGQPRETPAPPRVGASWCRPWTDVFAARAAGMSFGAWLRWVSRCDARSTIAWDDPLPGLHAVGRRLVARGSRRVAGAARPRQGATQ